MVKKKSIFKFKPLALIGRKKRFNTLVLIGVTFSFLSLAITTLSLVHSSRNNLKEVLGSSVVNVDRTQNESTITPSATPSPIESGEADTIVYKPPTPTPTLTPTPKPAKEYTAEKIGDSTYKIPYTSGDSEMASASDIYNALNSYRGEHGMSNLAWDGGLANFAQERANTFASSGSLDSHAGFRSFMDNDGFSKLGFNGLGENSAQLAGNMSGDRIIREIFGADAEHDGNQLDDWTHVGIAVNGYFINVNFGKNKR